MKVDVAVIGAGAFGLSTALHLALRGSSVALIERRTPGSQASGRAAGLFKSVQADELRTYLARRSIEKVCSFGDWAGVELDVVRSGSVLVARTEAHTDLIIRERDQSRGWGVALTDLTSAELAERVSYYRPSGGECAIWCPEDVYIDEPMSLVRAYLAGCLRSGVEVLENEPVSAVVVADGRVVGIETAGRRIEASAVVDAAGGWARQMAETAGSLVATTPVRHQLVISASQPEINVADPITRVVDAAVYLRPARGGLMVGGFEPDPLPLDPRAQGASFSTDDVPLDVEVLRRMAGLVGSEIPLAEAAVNDPADHRAGLFTMSPDGRFLLGPAPAVEGLWIANGCNGSGFSSSPALGEALADWIVDGKAGVDLSPLSPARFGPLPDTVLIERGVWQYAHYYDPEPRTAL